MELWTYIIKFGKSKEIKLRTKPLDIIGYGDKTVYNYFKVILVNMNYWNTLFNVVIQQFMIYNVSDKHKDISKYQK